MSLQSAKVPAPTSDGQTTAVASDTRRSAPLRDGSWKDSPDVRQWAAGVSQDPDVMSSSDTYVVTQQLPLADVMSVGVETKLPSLKRLYYRLYNEVASEPHIASRNMVDASDPTLGYVHVEHIPPPYTVTNVLAFICTSEKISTPCSLFLLGSETKPAKPSATLKLLKSNFPGSTPDTPIRIVVLSSTQQNSPSDTANLTTTLAERNKTSMPGRVKNFCYHGCVGTYTCCYMLWWLTCLCPLCDGHCEAALEQCGCPDATKSC
ncbi:hypothetical protein DL93DRAFT_2082938 [Clavulina sp. PMI_390]|nr:hypothetical protein DL93DRAFT_2082938 [Clavulina sp. PMI_390]